MSAPLAPAQAALSAPPPKKGRPSAKTQASARSPLVEIWLRQKGSRRQAFYRPGGTCGWSTMPVPLADKALRQGRVSIGPLVDAVVVPCESERPAPHPMRDQFVEQAQSLNHQIDALNGAARIAS